jgi:sigma-E factor negative regulatory protein RseA
MTDQDKELRMRISLLMDSDLDGRDNPRLIERLESDEELKATWARYNLIGDYMRSPQGALADSDFAKKVSAAISEEPTILSPKSFRTENSLKPKIISVSLAASLALVAIMIGKSMNDHSEVFINANAGKDASSQVANISEKDNQADSQFNDYLVMHNETASMAGSAGMLPYVRLVGSTSGR